MRNILTSLLLAGCSLYGQAQGSSNIDPDIRSIQLHKGDSEQSLPVITAGTGDYLTLRFDDLSETRSNLRYTLVHCNADGQPDNLFLTEYMAGFAENYFPQPAHSHRARVGYTHYALQIPNDDVQLKVSGNYLLKVYETDASQPLFVRGFSVLEQRTAATLALRGASVTGEPCLQQLELAVNHSGLAVRHAARELKVRVLQNGYVLPNAEQPVPAFMENGRTDYTLPDRNRYAGGNEFRTFDTRSLDFGAQGVQQLYRDRSGFLYAVLQHDEARDRNYFYTRDLNGRYHIAADRTTDSHVEAEYVTAIFTLRAPEPYEGEVYVFGELSNFALQPAFRMTYNDTQQAYELNALCKQGLYNYRYVLADKQGRIDWEAIEGCFAETENVYTVYIYFRSATDRYDRLTGLFTVSSGK